MAQRGAMRLVWVMAVAFATACGQDAAPPASPATTTATSSPKAATSPATIATSASAAATTPPPYEWPDDVTEVAAFWARLRTTGASEIYRFRTVEELADSATVVVVAAAVGPGPSAMIGGDPDNNEVTTVRSLIVEVEEVARTRTELLGMHTPVPGEHLTVIIDHAPRAEISPTAVLLFLQAPGDDRYYYQAPPDQIAPQYREYYIRTLEAWEAFRAGKHMFLNSQSLMAGDDTTTVSPWMPANSDLLSISGTPIAEIVGLIRSMPPPEA